MYAFFRVRFWFLYTRKKVFYFKFFYKLHLNIDNLVQIEENSKNHCFSKKCKFVENNLL